MQYVIKTNEFIDQKSTECYISDLYLRSTTSRIYHAKRYGSISEAQDELNLYLKRNRNWKPTIGFSKIFDISQCEIIPLTEKDFEREKKNEDRKKIKKSFKENEVKYIVKVIKEDTSTKYYLLGSIDPKEDTALVTIHPEEALTFDSALNLYYHFHDFNFDFEIVLQKFPENWIDFDLLLDDEERRESREIDSTDYEKTIMRSLRNGDGEPFGF